MKSLYLQRGRALTTSLLVAGACSFLAAQGTTVVLFNETGLRFGLEPVKGPHQTAVPVRASVEGFTGGPSQAIPALNFRDAGKRDSIKVGKDRMLVLSAADTKGSMVKVGFQVTGLVAVHDLFDSVGTLEYTACQPKDKHRPVYRSLALPEGSELAKNFRIVPLDRTMVSAKLFEGKDYAFFSLQPVDSGLGSLSLEDEGGVGSEGHGDGDRVESKRKTSTTHGAAGKEPFAKPPTAPALTTTTTTTTPTTTAKGKAPSKYVVFSPSQTKPDQQDQPVPAKSGNWLTKLVSTKKAKVAQQPTQTQPTLPGQPGLATTTLALPVETTGAGRLDAEPVPTQVPQTNLWPVGAKTKLAANDNPVVLHTVTFKPGEVAEGEVFTGRALVRTKGVTTGSAMIGIRFDTSDGKSHFGGRLDAKMPTESRSAEWTNVGVHAKAPANVTRVTFSIQSRGFNPGATADFDAVTFRRHGSAPR